MKEVGPHDGTGDGLAGIEIEDPAGERPGGSDGMDEVLGMQDDLRIAEAGVGRNRDVLTRLVADNDVGGLGLVALHEELEEPIGAKIAELEAAGGVGLGGGQTIAELNGLDDIDQAGDAGGPVVLVIGL